LILTNILIKFLRKIKVDLESSIQYLIYSYISYCFDEYGILPNEDDVYLRFQNRFDNGVPFEIAQEEMQKFARCHDLTDIDIQWEGELVGNHSG
jgi:hypothetical protein